MVNDAISKGGWGGIGLTIEKGFAKAGAMDIAEKAHTAPAIKAHLHSSPNNAPATPPSIGNQNREQSNRDPSERPAMNFHQTANALEAGLWAVIGGIFAWQAIRSSAPSRRGRCWIAAGAFLIFGLSDVIEITTGAWWRPWWLFAMKAACVLVLVGLYIENVRSRRK